MKISKNEVEVITTTTRNVLHLTQEEKDTLIDATNILHSLKFCIINNEDFIFISHKDFNTIKLLCDEGFELKDEYVLVDETISEKDLEDL